MMSALKRFPGGIKALTLEVASFLATRWKLLSVLALAVFAVVMPLVLLLPEQYSKEVSLTVTPRIGEAQERLGQKKPQDKGQVGRTALIRIKESRFGSVEVVSTYDPSGEKVDVLMRAPNRASLEEAARSLPEALDDGFRKNYEKALSDQVRTRRTYIENALASQRNYLIQIDTALEYNLRLMQSSTDLATVETASSTVQRLQPQREDLSTSIEQKEDELAYFEQVLEDPSPAADQAVEVRVASESEVRQAGTTSSSSLSAAALFALTAAVAAVLWWTVGLGRPRRLRGRSSTEA